MSSQFYFPPYNQDLAWSKFDAVYGVSAAAAGMYFYATQDITTGCYSPSGVYSYSVTQYARSDDVTTLTYTHTGGMPFAAGSIIRVTGVTQNTTVNFTGMVLNGGSGTLSYVNPGWPQTQGCVGTITCLCPAWTTGHFFQPTYSSKVGTQNNTITTQLGDGYSQRSPNGINSFTQTWNLVYQNRSKREMRSMVNYVEDKAGATAVELLIPDAFLTNQPNAKYVISNVDVTSVSFGLYDMTETVTRIFDL